ncbi:MAG: hypothetical protein FWG90_10760 [Oscillospiraceae bacterium]|nr:hypothetical protein [Oscillospiraceae bacterium]
MQEKIIEALNEFIAELVCLTTCEYHKTGEYKLWQEKIDRMYVDCEGEFTPSQLSFVNECFDLMTCVYNRETEYAFRRAFSYSVFLLKQAGDL